jgi:hypothetical protein
MKIADVPSLIDNGVIALSEFQRGYVWNRFRRPSSGLRTGRHTDLWSEPIQHVHRRGRRRDRRYG